MRRVLFLLAWAVFGAAPAAAEVTIASIAPSSYQPDAPLGSLRGTELVIETLNADGGLIGETLRHVEIDDACNAEQARAAVKVAMGSHPVLVMGGACSTAAIELAKLLAAGGILQMVPNAPSQTVMEAGITTIFRMTGRGDREGAFVAALIASRWADRRIAVAGDGRPNWEETAAGVIGGLRQHGVPVALVTHFVPDQHNYPDLVRAVKDNHIGLLFVSGLSVDVGLIAREIAAAGLTPQIVASRSGRAGPVLQAAGPAIEGMVFPDRRPWLHDALADPVLAAEKARDGDIDVFLVSAYVATKIWAEAVRAAGTFEARAVAAALHGRRFATVLGDIAFDAKGNLTPDSEAWTWYRWHDGKIETLP